VSLAPAALAAPALLLRGAALRLLDALLPPRCLSCGEEVAEPGLLCAGCWRAITFFGAPHCACCGLPFAFAGGAAMLCGGCAGAPPPWARARSVMRYDAN
jgi:predicted amidophosphoribosyltransferase